MFFIFIFLKTPNLMASNKWYKNVSFMDFLMYVPDFLLYHLWIHIILLYRSF